MARPAWWAAYAPGTAGSTTNTDLTTVERVVPCEAGKTYYLCAHAYCGASTTSARVYAELVDAASGTVLDAVDDSPASTDSVLDLPLLGRYVAAATGDRTFRVRVRTGNKSYALSAEHARLLVVEGAAADRWDEAASASYPADQDTAVAALSWTPAAGDYLLLGKSRQAYLNVYGLWVGSTQVDGAATVRNNAGLSAQAVVALPASPTSVQMRHLYTSGSSTQVAANIRLLALRLADWHVSAAAAAQYSTTVTGWADAASASGTAPAGPIAVLGKTSLYNSQSTQLSDARIAAGGAGIAGTVRSYGTSCNPVGFCAVETPGAGARSWALQAGRNGAGAARATWSQIAAFQVQDGAAVVTQSLGAPFAAPPGQSFAAGVAAGAVAVSAPFASGGQGFWPATMTAGALELTAAYGSGAGSAHAGAVAAGAVDLAAPFAAGDGTGFVSALALAALALSVPHGEAAAASFPAVLLPVWTAAAPMDLGDGEGFPATVLPGAVEVAAPFAEDGKSALPGTLALGAVGLEADAEGAGAVAREHRGAVEHDRRGALGPHRPHRAAPRRGDHEQVGVGDHLGHTAHHRRHGDLPTATAVHGEHPLVTTGGVEPERRGAGHGDLGERRRRLPGGRRVEQRDRVHLVRAHRGAERGVLSQHLVVLL
ncbi:MAG: hypothetical protein KDB39_12695, partial [Austwickia sp.]|nr:hypothetical protein [Austwickia sp.]